MGQICYFVAVMLMLLACSPTHAELEPKDTRPSDQWVAVTWCGALREVIEKNDEFWAVYDGVSFGGELASREACEAIVRSKQFSESGIFVVGIGEGRIKSFFDSLIHWQQQFGCRYVSYYIGQIDGFVTHAGEQVPYLSGAQGGVCVKFPQPAASITPAP